MYLMEQLKIEDYKINYTVIHIEDQAFAQLEGAVLSPISTEDPVMMARREQSYILAIQTLTVLARKEITFSSRKREDKDWGVRARKLLSQANSFICS